jgi:hypothetical protein
MSEIDYAALKKKRELEIVRMIYLETQNSIKIDHAENPDFLLHNFLKNFLFGVEVTELYRNQSSARLQKITGYVDELVEKNRYRHKDDFQELRPDNIDILNEDGSIRVTLKGVVQNRPSLGDFLQILERSILEKDGKLLHYSTDARFHNLLIYDTENYFDEVKVENFYTDVYSDIMKVAVQQVGFREVYFIGKIESQMRFIPMKGYLLYACAGQFEGFYKHNIEENITVLDFANLFIWVLSKLGFEKAVVHQAESFISISYGDFSLRIDLETPSGNTILLNRDLDYSDGIDTTSFSSGFSFDETIISQFKTYQSEHTFHSNASFLTNDASGLQQ